MNNPNTKSLTGKTVSGVFWSGTSQVLKQIFQFIITAILARLLSPSDFGTLGMATVFTAFITIFNEMGISASIIQKKDPKKEELSSLFFINLIVGLFLTIITISFSSLIAEFYQKDELKLIMIFLSFNFFLGSFIIVQQALFQKNLEFKKLMATDIFSIVLSGSIGIFLAYNGLGVWSLVFQSIGYTFFRAILLWLFSSFRPEFVFNWDDVKKYFSFSSKVLGSTVINYFARNLDYLLIGKFLGATPLGYYTLAYRLMLYPLRNITSVINTVLFPVFSTIQDNKSKIREMYLKAVQYISFITFPMMLGLFVIASEFILVIYGNRWRPVIFIIRVFCFTGMCQSIGTTVGTIFYSTGRADMQFKWTLFTTPLACLAIIIGLDWGVNGVAIAYTSISLLLWLLSHVIANRLIDLKMREFLASFGKIALISFIMLVIISGFHYFQKDILNLNNLNLMVISIILGIFCYLILMKLFRVKIIDELIMILKDQLNYTRLGKNKKEIIGE